MIQRVIESWIEQSLTKVLFGVLAHHVEMHGIVPDAAALPELIELDALQLVGLEALADHRVAAVSICVSGRRELGWSAVSPRRHDAHAARQERDRGARVDRLDVQVEPADPRCFASLSGYFSP